MFKADVWTTVQASYQARGSEMQKEFVEMHSGTSQPHALALNRTVGEAAMLHPALSVGTPDYRPRCSKEGEVQIQMDTPEEPSNRRGSGGARSNSSHSHSHSHSHSREASAGERSESEDGEPRNSFSELRYILRWLQKSLPYILILCTKLVFQHSLGIAVGVGLCVTFLYANRAIINQVFLQERRSVLQCLWLLGFLTASSLLLYNTFHSQSLYFSLIFLPPNIDPIGFWDVLWIVGIADFILKFLCLGFKCLVLLVPLPLMSFKSRLSLIFMFHCVAVTFRAERRTLYSRSYDNLQWSWLLKVDYMQSQWYVVIEEVGQFHRSLVPLPVWFRYLIGDKESEGFMIWTLGILLSLIYFILKLLEVYGQWSSFRSTVQSFFHKQLYGIAASQHQCSDAGEICPICQAEFREPVLLTCQHVFCEECISLWFNREKTCPLCRTVILDHVQAWRDGATSTHLQVY